MGKKWFFLFVVALCISGPHFSHQSISAQESDEVFVLEEITVTAEKRAVNVQDTAISMSAITGATIRDKSQSTLDSVLKDIAGVNIGGFTSGASVFIRGVGSVVDPEMADPSSALMIDGVYSQRTEAVMGALYDISRVEVLRGPQGTLYGRNAIGGTVNLISNPPKDEFEAIANFQIGDYNLKHLDGVLNFPISDDFAGRIAFLREVRDGYINNGDGDSDKISARAKLLFEPNEKFSILATFERNEDYSRNMYTMPVSGSAGNLPDMGWYDEFDWEAGWQLPVGADDWAQDEWHWDENLYENKTTTGTLQMDWDLNWATLTVLPTYTETSRLVYGDLMMGTAKEYSQETARNMKGTLYSVEARLASPSDSTIQWVAGIYIMESENRDNIYDDEFSNFEVDTDDEWLFDTSREPQKTHALFGQATYPVTNRFRITGGLRFSRDQRNLSYRFGNGNITDPSDPYYDQATLTNDGHLQYISPVLEYEDDDASMTFKAGIEKDMFINSMLYAHVSSGFKAGGLNYTAPPTTFEPEELISYEIGLKNRFLNNRLQLNFGAYYYDYENMQIKISQDVYVVDTGDTSRGQTIVNSDSSTNMGLELESDYLLTQNDKLSVTLAYMDAEYGNVPEYDNLEGTQVTNSPDWVGTFGYEHTWVLENGSELVAGFDTKISSGYWNTVERNHEGAYQDSYSRSDAHVNYHAASGKWYTGIWVKNIENDAQTTYVFPFCRRKVSDPRTVGINISFRY